MPEDEKTNTFSVVFDKVGFSYNNNNTERAPALTGCSFEHKQGEFLVLVGHNSSGKSTLVKMINGLLIPDEGQISVDGLITSDSANHLSIRKQVGLVFQNPDNQTVTSVVEDDVAFGPENLNLESSEIEKRVSEALKTVGMLERRKKLVANLSGGQKQLIAIAGVLALRPKLIILDEATSLLDPKGRRQVLKKIVELNRMGIGIIMITHKMEEVLLGDRVIALEKGGIIFDGKSSELFSNKELLLRAGLEPPEILELTKELRDLGYDIKTPKKPADIVEEICKLR